MDNNTNNSFVPNNSTKASNKLNIFYILIIIFLIITLVFIVLKYVNLNNQQSITKQSLAKTQSQLKQSNNAQSNSINHNEYQGIFLNTGQVYFGKVIYMNNKFIKLTKIYYIQNEDTNKQLNQNVTLTGGQNLVKLGCELHGPEDLMVINNSHITFWENLKKTSKVSTAITQYESQNPKQTCL